MNVLEAPFNRPLTIVRLEHEKKAVVGLREIGLREGKTVTKILGCANGPIIKLGNIRFFLSLEIASHIIVEI